MRGHRYPVGRVLALALCTGAVALAWQFSGVRVAAQPRGKSVYDAHCASCHGETGQGDGPGSHLLLPRPRDFTAGRYKIRSTETGSVPADDDLLRSVRRGLYGTSMLGWDQLLPEDDIRAVVDYIKTFSPRFATESPRPLAAGLQSVATPESVQRGAGVYGKLQCGKCHGADGRGTGATATEFEDDWRQPLRIADLTEPWTFRGGATAQDIYLRFRTGMSGTPMPSFDDAASEPEMWDLANYVLSLARKPVWVMSDAEVSAHYAGEQAAAKANPVKRGKYLVDTLACGLCHSPADANRRIIPGMYLAGGLLMRLEPFGDYPTGNLTSDRETGLGGWTDDEIKRVITRGTLRDGTRLLPYPMDWPSFALMTPDDLSAIVAYLRTVPAVVNKVPAPSRTFLPIYLWGKFKLLFMGGDPPIVIYPGNAGSAGAGSGR